jgi:exodeoxyribonuclease III
MRLYSWKINRLRAASRWLPDWLTCVQPDVLCLQETRCGSDDLLEDARHPAGYARGIAAAARHGYSGVATFCRTPPTGWRVGLGLERFDVEGRVLVA